MTDIPMKPCPLACGGPAEWISVHPQGYIRCTKCKLATIIDDQFELTEAWNTRPPTANPLPDEVGATQAVALAMVGRAVDPFAEPETWAHCGAIAQAVIERLSTDRDSVIEEDEVERVAKAIYAARPFVMASTSTTNGVQLGKAFDWDAAPAYYQSDMLDLARAAIPAIRERRTV